MRPRGTPFTIRRQSDAQRPPRRSGSWWLCPPSEFYRRFHAKEETRLRAGGMSSANFCVPIDHRTPKPDAVWDDGTRAG